MPDVFSAIFDQPAAIAAITQAAESGRLPHGVIFAGPAGVGKFTTAVALAKWFLCDRGNDAPAMRLIDAGTHSDFHVITKELVRLTSKTSKATTLSIDVIRDHLVTPAMRKSSTGTGKVFIVEEADLMQSPAQNSLLKTLEEPAGRTLIVLLTPRDGDLLPTIRSRAQVFRFGQLQDKTVFTQLKLKGVDPKTAEQATKIAGGSLGMALKWLEDGVVDKSRELLTHLGGLLDAERGSRPTADLAVWLKTAADDYAKKQIERDENSSKDFATRNGLAIYLTLAADHLRAALATEPHGERLERICQAIDAVARCEQYLDGNVNVQLALAQFAGTIEAALTH